MRNMQLFAGVFWGNGGILVAFAVLVAMAIALRRRSASHKRLMLLASISITPPATHRVGLLPFLQALDSREANALVTAWGVPGSFAWFLVCIFVIPGTALGETTAEWLVRIATN